MGVISAVTSWTSSSSSMSHGCFNCLISSCCSSIFTITSLLPSMAFHNWEIEDQPTNRGCPDTSDFSTLWYRVWWTIQPYFQSLSSWITLNSQQLCLLFIFNLIFWGSLMTGWWTSLIHVIVYFLSISEHFDTIISHDLSVFFLDMFFQQIFYCKCLITCNIHSLIIVHGVASSCHFLKFIFLRLFFKKMFYVVLLLINILHEVITHFNRLFINNFLTMQYLLFIFIFFSIIFSIFCLSFFMINCSFSMIISSFSRKTFLLLSFLTLYFEVH